MHHILGNKVLEYDVDDRGVIVDEREYDRTVNPKPNIADWVKEHMVFWYDMSKPVDVYVPGVTYANPFVALGGKITYDKTINNVKVSSGVIETRVSSPSKKYKVRVTGITSNETLRYVIYGDTSLGELATIIFDMKKDGEYELPASTYSATYNMKWQVIAASYPHTCNITIEQIPSYPNALVTDGVDDYGQVQNLQQGVKVLFMTANPLGLYKTWYAQDSFSIYGQPNTIAYNYKNTNGVTYLDGTLNETIPTNNLLNKKQIVTIVNPTDGGNNSIMFFNSYGLSYMNMAFYGSIGFDSVPTKQNDGFTEQDLINYVLENLITK